MSTPQIKQRLGTLHDNRAFYVWYLSRKRSAGGSKGVTVTARVTEDGKSRSTEDGQSREIES